MTQQEQRNLKRDNTITERGGQCEHCGFNVLCCLTFHDRFMKPEKLSRLWDKPLSIRDKTLISHELVCLHCHAKIHDKTTKHNLDKEPSNLPVGIKTETSENNKIEAIKRLGGKCYKCRTNKLAHLTFHRILGKEEAPYKIWNGSEKSIDKNLEEYEIVCYHCHIDDREEMRYEKELDLQGTKTCQPDSSNIKTLDDWKKIRKEEADEAFDRALDEIGTKKPNDLSRSEDSLSESNPFKPELNEANKEAFAAEEEEKFKNREIAEAQGKEAWETY